MAAARSRRRKKKVRLTLQGKIIVGVSVTLIILSVLTVVGVLALNMNIFQGEGNLIDGIQTPSSIKNKVSTFLIVGISDDEAERESTALTDTIMVATVDFEQQKVSVLQIPRDTFVGKATPTGKINAIYNRGKDWDYNGLEGLSQMIYEMFQLNIDHYVTLKMDGFADIVDSIGGVEMNVPVDMELNGTYVSAGTQVLNGKQAIAVVRTRNVYNNGDLGRIETQRAFLSAFVQKCLSLGVGDMTRLIPQCFDSVNTDVTPMEAIDYYKAIRGVDMGNISMMSVVGEPAYYGDQSVFSVYPNAMAEMLNQYFRPYSDRVPAERLQIKTLTEEPPLTNEFSDDEFSNHVKE